MLAAVPWATAGRGVETAEDDDVELHIEDDAHCGLPGLDADSCLSGGSESYKNGNGEAWVVWRDNAKELSG